MRPTLRAYLELVRVPNLLTAAADVVAGFACNDGQASQWTTCLALTLASMSLYAAGVALNDVCDAARDRAERPTRPIPSGRISRRSAAILAAAALWVGLTVTCFVSSRTFLTAASLVATIVAYNTTLKSTPLGPVAMGMCRSLNLLLGMYGTGEPLADHALSAIALLGLYIASVTFFARDETKVSSPLRLAVGLTGAAFAVAGLFPLNLLSPHRHFAAAVPVLAILLVLTPVARRALAECTPTAVQSAVKRHILALILFDAVIAWSGGGPWAGAVVASLLLPTVSLARLFRVT